MLSRLSATSSALAATSAVGSADPELRLAIGWRAHEYVRDRYTLDKYLDHVFSVMTEFLEEPNSQAYPHAANVRNN